MCMSHCAKHTLKCIINLDKSFVHIYLDPSYFICMMVYTVSHTLRMQSASHTIHMLTKYTINNVINAR